MIYVLGEHAQEARQLQAVQEVPTCPEGPVWGRDEQDFFLKEEENWCSKLQQRKETYI